MLFLCSLSAAISIAIFAWWIVHCRHALRTSQQLRWGPVLLVIFFSFAGALCYEWSPASRAEIFFEYGGDAVMVVAAVILLRTIVAARSTARSRRAALRLTVAAISFALLTLLAGHAVRVTPRVAAEGWWAGVPSPVLVLNARHLPHDAISPRTWLPRYWSLKARWERGDLWEWEKAALRGRLERRFLDMPSDFTLEEVAFFAPARADSLAAFEFERQVNAFCDTADAEARRNASSLLCPFLPTNMKIPSPHIGEAHGLRVTKGRVPRLIELTADPDTVVCGTAIDLLAVCGDDAVQALPTLAQLTDREDYYQFGAYRVERTLSYLAEHSSAVRERFREMYLGDDLLDWLLVVNVRRRDLSEPEIQGRLIESLRSDDAVTANFAIYTLGGSSTEDWRQIVPVLFEQLARNRPNRARYLRAFPEHGGAAEAFSSQLLTALADSSPGIRDEACSVVHGVWRERGIDTLGARPTMERLRNDPDPTVAYRAKAALEMLERRSAR